MRASCGRPFTAYRSTIDELPEPLCALFEPASAELVQAAIAAGRHCPRKLLIASGVPLLTQPVAALANMNTPEDFAAPDK